MMFSRRFILFAALVALLSLSACDQDFFAVKKSDEPVVTDPTLSEEGQTKPIPRGSIPEPADTSSPPTSEDTTTADNKPAPSPIEPTAPATPTEVAVRPHASAPNSFADLVERVQPAVVNVYTEQIIPQREVRVDPIYGPYSVTRPHRTTSLGSGFIADKEGYIFTNTHVIDGARTVKVSTVDGTEISAAIVGTDPMTDIAVLKIRPFEGMQVLPLGNSDDVRVGDWLMAVGNPFGLQSTVTTGILSARGRRNIPIRGEIRYMDFLQTDASINPGNSGGPLIAMDGTVVGINTAINAQGQGIGFAIPANMAQYVFEDLRTGREVSRSWLGIQVSNPPRNAQGGKTPGAMIAAIVREGPAAQAGLRKGDIIMKIGDEYVDEPRSLPWLASTAGIGSEVPLLVRRGEEEFLVTVRMGRLPN